MEFYSTEHIYRCIPPVLGIRTAWDNYQEQLKEWEKDKENKEKPEEVKPVIIHLKCLSIPELDEDTFREVKIRSEKAPEEAQKIVAGFTKQRIKEKVIKIENLILDGEVIEDFDTFYELGPPELVSWVCKAVNSSFILSKAEVKN